MEVSAQLQSPAALPLGSNSRFPLDKELGEPQSRCGQGDGEEHDPTLPGIKPIGLHGICIGHNIRIVIFHLDGS
jgi:hypothetical protein